MNPDSQPAAKAKIEIRGINQPVADTRLFMNQAFTDEQGRWTINKVPDGDYLIVTAPAIISLLINNKDEQMNEVNAEGGNKICLSDS